MTNKKKRLHLLKRLLELSGTKNDVHGRSVSVFPFLQQAVRLKEKGIASEIVAVSCGPAKSEVKIKTV